VSGPRRKELLKDSGPPVLAWWDHERNDTATWETVTVRARREAHWRCPDCDLRFTARIDDMVTVRECPDCEPRHRAERQAELDRYKDLTIADVPELLAAWADDADPSRVMVVGGPQLQRFRCSEGHHPRLTPYSFLRSGCPSCRGNATRTARLDAVAADPAAHGLNPEIASQWHPTKNARIRLETISPGSRRLLWWREPSCGHEWQQTPADREKGQRLRCPQCRTILDSLGYHYPELAAEWSPANPLSAWQVRPSGQTAFTPVWVCANQPGHTWQATLSSRAAGSGCPECREAGKSRVELAHHAAAQRLFGNAASGRAVRSEAFARRARWLVDIVIELPSGEQVAVEYDGAYWHADKVAVDTEKSTDLLAAGFWVARLREHPLPPLPVVHDRYREFVVHSSAPDAEATMAQVHQWSPAGS
jgi:ssDNA-binding Zn-finger/Zn-ribbon topoisomerase 1